MNKNIRDGILIALYTYFIINQIVCISYIINKSDDINRIMKNVTILEECKHDNINRLDNGTLYNNTLAILISGTSIIIFFTIMMLQKLLHNNKYHIYPNINYNNNLEYTAEENTGLISNKIIKKEIFELIINILFVLSIIVFIICNGVEFILQLNNINDTCLHIINNYINNFYVIYKLILCISFFSSYSLFFIIPLFI